MNEKRTRYCITIFALDRINQSFSMALWNKDNFGDYMKSYDKNYGLHLIKQSPIVSIIIEYTNIIWNYKIYYGSCKKRFKTLFKDDERWSTIEKGLQEDLKMMGIEELTDNVLVHLQGNQYFEYVAKREVQFKKYCV